METEKSRGPRTKLWGFAVLSCQGDEDRLSKRPRRRRQRIGRKPGGCGILEAELRKCLWETLFLLAKACQSANEQRRVLIGMLLTSL
jgi:hypothetical protein